MIDQLAAVLRLDELGRNELFELAGYGGDSSVSRNEPRERRAAIDSEGEQTRRLSLHLAIVMGSSLLSLAIGVAVLAVAWPRLTMTWWTSQGWTSAPPQFDKVAGWVQFAGAEDRRSGHAWVTVWYRDPQRGWRDRSVQIHEGSNPRGCSEYVPLADLRAPASTCYELLDVPRMGMVQVRVHYERASIRDHYFDFLEGEATHWVGMTLED
jgi:hypothetical protein